MNWLTRKLINPTLSRKTIDISNLRSSALESLRGVSEEIDVYHVSGILIIFGRSWPIIFDTGATPEQAWELAEQSVSLSRLLRLSWPHIAHRRKRVGPIRLGNHVDPITLNWTKSAERGFTFNRTTVDMDAAVALLRYLQRRKR